MSEFESLISQLRSLSAELNEKAARAAEQDSAVARTLVQAVNMLAEEHEKNKELQAELSIAKIFAGLNKGSRKEFFTFLIDGSGSMTGDDDKLYPLKAALDGFKSFSAAIGNQARAVFWADEGDVIHVSTDEDFYHAKYCYSSEFVPAVYYMGSVARGPLKPHRFVVVSDGCIEDSHISSLETQNLLRGSKEVFIDFIVINDKRSTAMENLANSLATEFPQQVGVHNVKPGESLDNTLAAIVEKAPKLGKKTSRRPKGPTE